MAQVTFTIPDALATELNAIAVAAGFPSAKAMVIAYLRATIKASRGNKALAGIRETAETQADIETAALA